MKLKNECLVLSFFLEEGICSLPTATEYKVSTWNSSGFSKKRKKYIQQAQRLVFYNQKNLSLQNRSLE